MRVRNIFAVTISALLLIAGASATDAAPEAKEVYIIKFADNVNLDNEIAALKAGGGDVRFEYRNVFKGAAVEMNSAQASGLSRNPKVERISKDQEASTQVATYNDSITSSGLWGLDRIDQVSGSNKTYSYTSLGSGVNAYVVDTGIDIKNTEFGSRAFWVKNFVDTNNTDCNGHGTHVAGTIGSRTYGVAKNVNLMAIKVLNCAGSGSYSRIIAALDWIKANAITPAVVNMSLGGPVDSTLNETVNSLAAVNGIVVVVAAGNESTNACNKSPASATSAITVGASTSANVNASYSNFGSCVDIFAPGSGILSTTPKNKTGTMSGTSMASPHVAGVVARLLSTGTTSGNVDSTLKTSTSRISLSSGISGTTNILLYANPEN